MTNLFFNTFQIEKISTANFDEMIIDDHSNQLTCVFLWGKDCPNCDIAKKVLVERHDEVNTLNLKWFEANIYEDFDLAKRFGLFGIPVFLFFINGKKLGKISPFPAFDNFYEAVSKLK